ncbi:MAG: C40 family peptidase [Parachlamydiales bacterium]|nr:C40 family peptidase [Parachlamydiales bacterium]
MNNLLRVFFLIFISMTSSIYAKNFYISKSVVNLHKEAKEISDINTQAIYGTPIKILKKKNNWFFVIASNKYQGWVEKTNIISIMNVYPQHTKRAKVKSLWTHVYYIEDTEPYPPIITLPFESEIEVISPKDKFSNRWIKVRLIDGKIGFVQSRDLDFEYKILSIEEAIDLGKNFLNIPYYWGGNSSFGYDCSAFVQMLYRQMGVNIFRNTSDQINDPNLEEVKSLKDLQKGDLVFFSSDMISVTHVAMYIGDKTVIHSKAKNVQPKIQTTKISSNKTIDGINVFDFVTARRIKNR